MAHQSWEVLCQVGFIGNVRKIDRNVLVKKALLFSCTSGRSLYIRCINTIGTLAIFQVPSRKSPSSPPHDNIRYIIKTWRLFSVCDHMIAIGGPRSSGSCMLQFLSGNGDLGSVGPWCNPGRTCSVSSLNTIKSVGSKERRAALVGTGGLCSRWMDASVCLCAAAIKHDCMLTPLVSDCGLDRLAEGWRRSRKLFRRGS